MNAWYWLKPEQKRRTSERKELYDMPCGGWLPIHWAAHPHLHVAQGPILLLQFCKYPQLGRPRDVLHPPHLARLLSSSPLLFHSRGVGKDRPGTGGCIWGPLPVKAAALGHHSSHLAWQHTASSNASSSLSSGGLLTPTEPGEDPVCQQENSIANKLHPTLRPP